MPIFPIKQRVRIALGGFVFFLGIVLFVIAILVATENLIIQDVLQPELLIGITGLIGGLNVICGVILFQKAK